MQHLKMLSLKDKGQKINPSSAVTTTFNYYPFLKADLMEKDHKWLDRLNSILEDNLHDHTLNNNLISECLGVSERQFFRRLNEITDLTPRQYIRQFRLEKAKEYLETGTYLTVKESAYAVGFINVGYFIRHFSKEYGMTPLEVLKENGWR